MSKLMLLRSHHLSRSWRKSLISRNILLLKLQDSHDMKCIVNIFISQLSLLALINFMPFILIDCMFNIIISADEP